MTLLGYQYTRFDPFDARWSRSVALWQSRERFPKRNLKSNFDFCRVPTRTTQSYREPQRPRHALEARAAPTLDGIGRASWRNVIDVFGNLQSLHQALDYHLERHNVLASNVAHVDTPGYRPHDLARVEQTQFANLLNVAMARTSEGHLPGAADGTQSQVGRVFEDSSAGFGNDGNSVSLDREASKLAANHLRYDVVSTIVASEIKGLMYAANDGKG